MCIPQVIIMQAYHMLKLYIFLVPNRCFIFNSLDIIGLYNNIHVHKMYPVNHHSLCSFYIVIVRISLRP